MIPFLRHDSDAAPVYSTPASEKSPGAPGMGGEPDTLLKLREALRQAVEERPPKDVASLHARWCRAGVQAGGKDGGLWEELRCRLLTLMQEPSQALSRFHLMQEIIAIDLILLGTGDGEAWDSEAADASRKRVKRCLNDLAQAREEASFRIPEAFERLRAVAWLTQCYLQYEWVCQDLPRDLELQGLEVRRGIEKLAYETIMGIAALGLKSNRLDTTYASEVASDLKVIYHHAFDAGDLSALFLLGSGEGLGRILELSCAAAVLTGEAGARPATEGLFRFLEAAELYARLGLEAMVARCLEQARKMAPELPVRERSAAYLRIEQIHRQPVRFFLGHAD